MFSRLCISFRDTTGGIYSCQWFVGWFDEKFIELVDMCLIEKITQ